MARWFGRVTPRGVILALVLSASVADARMMKHFDLAGLVKLSESIVVADRVGPLPTSGTATPMTRYHVVRVLRGSAKAGTDVDVWDRGYDTTGHTIDARVVLFLGLADGKPFIVASGLRVVEAGKVFRFEQRGNPGPYEMVEQGKDPDDNWVTGSPQLDEKQLELAIADAVRRVDTLDAARLEKDPGKRRSAVLAGFAAPGGLSTGMGFYADLLAENARAILAGAGDLEGALMVEARDRTEPWMREDYASTKDLWAFASDTARAGDLRAIAIGAIARRNDYIDDDATVRAVIGLVGDPSPRVRVAAVHAAAMPAQVITEAARQKHLKKLGVEARVAIARQYATETDNLVLGAIADVYENSFKKPLPAHRGVKLAATGRIDGAYIMVDVRCLDRGVKVTGGSVAATANGKSVPVAAYNVAIHCGTGTGVGTSSSTPLAPGSYQVRVEVQVDHKPVSIPLGTVDADTGGGMILRP